MSERLFFAHTVEANFLRAFPPTAAARARYAAAGLDLSRPLLPAYPYDVWRRCLAIQREEYFPGLEPEVAGRRQGARYVASYFETMLGRALLALLRLIGPARVLARMSANFRSGNNFSAVSVSFPAERTARLEVNDVFAESPAYVVGMLEEGMRLAGTAIDVRVVETHGDAAVLEVRWA